MSTTSTVTDFKSALVAALALRAELANVQVAYAWPGPQTRPEAIFFGESLSGESEVPTIKAGRKQRSETYDLEIVCWVFHTAGTAATGAQSAEARAFELMQSVDDLLADDPRAGVAYVQWARLGSFDSQLAPSDKGWACALSRTINVQARLT